MAAGLFNASELGHLGNGEHQEMVVYRCHVTYHVYQAESNCIGGNLSGDILFSNVLTSKVKFHHCFEDPRWKVPLLQKTSEF